MSGLTNMENCVPVQIIAMWIATPKLKSTAGEEWITMVAVWEAFVNPM